MLADDIFAYALMAAIVILLWAILPAIVTKSILFFILFVWVAQFIIGCAILAYDRWKHHKDN